MGALAGRRGELARAIAGLPAFLRQFNTTSVNLRAALDDLDPLVIAARPAVGRAAARSSPRCARRPRTRCRRSATSTPSSATRAPATT